MSWLHDIPAERRERCRARARKARRMGRLIGVTLSVCFFALMRAEPDFRLVIEEMAMAGVAVVSDARAPTSDRIASVNHVTAANVRAIVVDRAADS